MIAHDAKANGTFATRRIFRTAHFVRRTVDEILKHVVEHAHDVFDEDLIAVPFIPCFKIERRQAAYSRPVITQMVAAGWQGDFRAEVRRRYLQAQIAVMLWHRVVHGVAENDVRLTSCKAGFNELLEQCPRVDGAADFAGLGAAQMEFVTSAYGFHERIGQQHTMVQVQRLTVEVTRWLTDFEEFFDFRMADIKIARRRATAQRPLRNRKRQAVHHADERNDAAGLAVEADRFANATDIAPIGADAAATRCEPDIFVPSVDDTFKAVVDRVQIAADWKAATRAAIGQYRRCRHEPQLRNIIIETLRMELIIGIGRRNAREKILIAFTWKQITVLQRVLAEFSQQRVTRRIGNDIKTTHVDSLARRSFFGFSDLCFHGVSYFLKYICHHCGHVVSPLACIPEIHLNL